MCKWCDDNSVGSVGGEILGGAWFLCGVVVGFSSVSMCQ